MRTAILVAAALVPTLAFAQATAPQLVQIDDDQANVAVLGLTVDQVDDLDLFDAQGTKLGDVEEVLGTDATTGTALAIDLEGGDDVDVIVDLTSIELQDERLVTALTAEQLRALPVWND